METRKQYLSSSIQSVNCDLCDKFLNTGNYENIFFSNIYLPVEDTDDYAATDYKADLCYDCQAKIVKELIAFGVRFNREPIIESTAKPCDPCKVMIMKEIQKL